MSWSTRLKIVVWIAVAFLAGASPALAKGKKPVRMRAVTFNIRFDFDNDGKNRWEHRVDAVAETIRASGATVVCLQEDKRHQIEDLQKRLGEYRFVGRGRNANNTGERCSILFLKRRVTLRGEGSFWLSDTPERPGSNTWGDKYPRKVTWALLEPKGGRRIMVLNLHLVEGDREKIRKQGIELAHDWLVKTLSAGGTKKKKRDEVAVLIAGDFNEDAGSEAQAVFTGSQTLGLRDAWETAAKRGQGWPGTFHGFKGRNTKSRIDWLLVGGPVQVLEAGKLEDKVEDRWPSDHYPVFADLEVR